MGARRLFVFGFGYSARRLARDLLAEGWQVTGTSRSGTGVDGVEMLPFSREQPVADLAARLAEGGALLSSVPPDERGDPVLDLHGAEIAAAAGGLDWIGYLSTTGVYGDRNGGSVDETSELRPTGERGRRRVAAEARWQALPQPAHIFRLAGIYGPGRGPFARLRAGQAQRIDKPGHAFARIHVDDIAAVLRASLDRPNPGRAYNVADEMPAPSADVLAHAAELIGQPPPPLVPYDQADLSPMARGFYRDNKRVSTARLREELGVRLTHPDYRAGLAAILEAETADRPGRQDR